MVDEPNKVQILEQLERIVTSEEFSASPRKRAFLHYIVEKTLEGEASNLKGYSIGVDVFNRGESFDPQADTIVRVQARNLRRALNMYYLTSGKNDSIRIDIPKGNYIPKFAFIKPEEVLEKRTGEKDDTSKTVKPATKQKFGITEGLLVLAISVAIFALVS